MTDDLTPRALRLLGWAEELTIFESGLLGWLFGYGLWLTALIYGIVALSVDPATVPAANVIATPVWLWQVIYGLTPVSAVILWRWPNWIEAGGARYPTTWVKWFHVGVPTISVFLSSLSLFVFALGTTIPARAEAVGGLEAVSQSLFESDGVLRGAIATLFIGVMQFGGLWLSVVFKRGREYRMKASLNGSLA